MIFRLLKDRLNVIRNIFSNYFFVILMGLISVFSTPFYIKHLGASEWGLVAVCITVQSMLLLLDAGLAQILPSQIAKFRHLKKELDVYKAALKFYSLVAVAIFIFGQILAPQLCIIITNANLNLAKDLEPLLRLLFLQFLFQFPNNAAIGFWNGMEMQHEINVRQFIFMTIKHFLAILVTLHFPKAFFYMFPFVIVGFFEFFLNKSKILSIISEHENSNNFDGYSIIKLLPEIWWFSFAVFLGMLLFQLDRIYLLRQVPINVYGYYVAVSNFSMLFMHLYAPIYRVFLPKFSSTKGVTSQHWKVLLVLIVTCFIPCCIVAIFSESILFLWLGDRHVSQLTASTFTYLVLAVGLNGLNSLAYMIYIRDGLYRRLLFLNVFMLVVEYSILRAYTTELSILSGGIAVFIALSIQFLYGCFFLYAYQKNNSPYSA